MDCGNCTAHEEEMLVGLPELSAAFCLWSVTAGRTAGLESAIRIALAGQLGELNLVNELTAYIT